MLRCNTNYLLIDIGLTYSDFRGQQYVETKSGLVLKTDYHPHKFLPRDGIVKLVCDELFFSKEPDDRNRSMLWETEVEIKEGDRAWFEYTEIISSLGSLAVPRDKRFAKIEEPKWIELEGVHRNTKEKCLTIHVFVKYGGAKSNGGIICVERNGEIICVNGYVLIRALKEKRPDSKLITLTHLGDNPSRHYGIIEYLGKPNKQYIDEHYKDNDIFKKGDTVIFNKKTMAKDFEYSMCAKMFPGDLFYYMQRKMLSKEFSDLKNIYTDRQGKINIEI
jgi:hypothetical protein